MKTRKLIAILLSLCLIIASASIASINAFADDTVYTSQDGLWKYRILDDGTAEIRNTNQFGDDLPAYLGDDKNIIIPDTIDGIVVSAIGNYAFSENVNIESISIGKSINSINGAPFFVCVLLTEFNVDNQNPYFSSVDGVLFDKDMTSLICYPSGKTATSYSIPNGVERLETDSFLLATNLESVYFSDSVETINDEAFVGCENLSIVELNSGLLSIGMGAFYMCSSLMEISIPSSVTYIGDMAFEETGLSTLNGFIGSTAQTYADENGYVFCPLDPTVPGDLNCDGSVQAGDYSMLKQFLSGTLEKDLNSYQLACADIDSDGAIDAFDLFELDKMLNSI